MNWLTERDKLDLDHCGFDAAAILDIEAALSPRPAWHPRPTCPGRWVSVGGIARPIRDDADCDEAAAIATQWYGPIPEPPKCR